MKRLIILVILMFICSAPAAAAENYHPGDVAVIDKILKINDAGHQLLTRAGWEIGRPETWPVLDPSPPLDLTSPDELDAHQSETSSTAADDRTTKVPIDAPSSGDTSTVVDTAVDDRMTIVPAEGPPAKPDSAVVSYQAPLVAIDDPSSKIAFTAAGDRAPITPVKNHFLEGASAVVNNRTITFPADDPPSGDTSTVVDGDTSTVVDMVMDGAGVVWREGRVVELSLNYGDLGGLIDVSGLSGLEVLKICYNREVSGIKGLDQLVNLTGLHLEGSGIDDLGDLGGLTELRWLSLSRNRLTEVRGLGRMRQLRRLSLDHNRLTALEGLGSLTELRQLNLARNRLASLEDLRGLRELRELTAADNLLTAVPGLGELVNLQYLFLARNQLTDLGSLAGLTRLKFLDVSGNRLTRLKGLNRPASLTLLYIDGNPLSDLNFLKTIPPGQLTDFGFSGDQFPHFSLAADFPRLKDLVISGETEPRSVDLAGRALESLTLYTHLSPEIFHNSGGVLFGTIIGDQKYRLAELRALRQRLEIRNFIVPSPQSPTLGDAAAGLKSGPGHRLEDISPLLAADFAAARGQARIYLFTQAGRKIPEVMNPNQLPPGAVKSSTNGEISFPAPGVYYLSLTSNQVKMPGFATVPEVIHYQDAFTVE